VGLRIGLLSTARINGALLTGARLTGAAEVVAVGSRDGERARAYADEHGIARAYGSYEDLLADPEVDAIYNPLPNSMHVPWSIRALEAGKHVLCEKPLTRRAADAEAAFAAAEAHGRVLAEAFMWRHHPQAVRLRELLDAGAIGEVRTIRSAFSFSLDDPTDLRMQAGLDGGALMDIGCYCLSGARLVAGSEPEVVRAEQVVGGDGVDIAFAATLRFPGDVLAVFDCGFRGPREHWLEVSGSEGTLRLADPWHGREPVIMHDDERIECERADPYASELEDLAAAVAGERPPRLGREDALGQARAIEALYESAANGGAVWL
jgi:predicted dehydrogenase